MSTETQPSLLNKLHNLLASIYAIPGKIPEAFFLLFARIAVAPVFFLSGTKKVVDCSFLDVITFRFLSEDSDCYIDDTTYYLFEEGDWALPFIPGELAATLATVGEHLFPVLLVLGLATRLNALALFGMTFVIQFFVYPDAWPTHILWFFPLLYIISRGPGAISLDHLIAKFANR